MYDGGNSQFQVPHEIDKAQWYQPAPPAAMDAGGELGMVARLNGVRRPTPGGCPTAAGSASMCGLSARGAYPRMAGADRGQSS